MTGKSWFHETVILGAGPAGLQLAYYLHGAGRDYRVIERGRPGAFFERFPRHGTLISINKVHTGSRDREINLRWDWNSLLSDQGPLFSEYSKRYFPDREDYVRYLRAFVEWFGLGIDSGVEVTQVERECDLFVLRAEGGREYRCRRLVVATGTSLPYLPPIEGLELAESYVDMAVSPERLTNQRVLILGKGNSAFETANGLAEHAALIHLASPSPIRMAWKTRFVGDLRAINNAFLDTYRLKGQNATLDGTVVRLERRNHQIEATFEYVHAPGEREVIAYDHVISCTGFRFDASIFGESCRPALTIDDRFPAQTSEWQSTNVPGLYFAGSLMQACDYKEAMSAFIHGFRYNVAALFHILQWKHHDVPLPVTELPATATALAQHVIERVNCTSALWQQPGFLCDVAVIDGSEAAYHRELPRAWAQERLIVSAPRAYRITLEFGAAARDPFDFERPHRDDSARAHESEALHPVVRYYERGELVCVHHVMEDLEADWSDEVHTAPLLGLFRKTLALSERAGDRRTAIPRPLLHGHSTKDGPS